MIVPASRVTPYTSLISFTIGLPTAVATYYQAWRARQESRELREGIALTSYCLEFVRQDGTSVNIASLDSLHSLPTVGEVVLLPGSEQEKGPQHGAYRILSMEHIYAPATNRTAITGQVHLVKIVASVDSVEASES
jgi:hypothetical protein